MSVVNEFNVHMTKRQRPQVCLGTLHCDLRLPHQCEPRGDPHLRHGMPHKSGKLLACLPYGRGSHITGLVVAVLSVIVDLSRPDRRVNSLMGLRLTSPLAWDFAFITALLATQGLWVKRVMIVVPTLVHPNLPFELGS